jgi:nucleoside-diphosphate-sugar epimerase
MDDNNFRGPVNIGSEEMISINDFTRMIIDVSGKNLSINNVEGPEGVRGRNSDNDLIKEKLGWKPTQPLRKGIEKTYGWIQEQIAEEKVVGAAK